MEEMIRGDMKGRRVRGEQNIKGEDCVVCSEVERQREKRK